MLHDWTDSKLGHGEAMCRRCFITNREAAALGCLTSCDVPPNAPAANENRDADDEDHSEPPMICPVTGTICTTEQDEFCEDYGCARRAGIDVDRIDY